MLLKNGLPPLFKDGYKVGHKFQYPEGNQRVYSNLTARQSRIPNINAVRLFALQFYCMYYLGDMFKELFFGRKRDEVIRLYDRRIKNYLGPIPSDHIGALHELGYLPLVIKAIPEGLPIPLRVPLLTIANTHDTFGWLTNMLETQLSFAIWKPITAATIAAEYRRVFNEFAAETVGADDSFVPWQGHDFSMRGLCGLEDTMSVGGAHLTQFTGTDTISAIDFLEEYYGANCEQELIGGSVAATEHSVMCAGGKDTDTVTRLLTKIYPSGIVSIVGDTWDFWKFVTETVGGLREMIMLRDGKLVVRPDSGDPVRIMCGDLSAPDGSVQRKGLVEALWDIFGGTITEKGYRLLDSHIGTIYGDSITLERQRDILEGLKAKGFSSYNVVLGIGSFTYQYNTRDTFGLAMKATYAVENGVGKELFKAPATDDGVKFSARGLLRVDRGADGRLELKECCTVDEEAGGELKTVYQDGQLIRPFTLAEVRHNARQSL